MKLSAVLAVVSALFAIVAAVLWFFSAVVKTPKSFSINVIRPDSMGLPFGGNPLGGTYVGQAYSEDLIALANALRRQSRFSAWAAFCAGVSAIFQTLSLYFYLLDK